MLSFAELNPLQAMVVPLFLKHRRLMLVLPRQQGKTEFGVRVCHDMLSDPVTRACLFLAKSKEAGRKAAREKFMRLFDANEFAVNTALVYRKDCATSVCYMDSVDKEPDRLRGGTYHFVHWSEVAFSKLEHGQTIDQIFQLVIKPTLETTDGYLLLESTMNGKNGWYDLLENHEFLGFKKVVVSLSQMVEMGLYDRARYDTLKAETLPDYFRQEYECEAVSFHGRAYPELTPDLIDANMPNPEPWQKALISIDWGFKDASCVLWAYSKDGVLSVYDEFYETEKLTDYIASAIKTRNAAYGITRFAATADHDPGKIEELQLRGIVCTNADKVNVLGNRLEVKELLFKKKLKIHPRCKMLLKDLQAATWDPKKDGEIDYKQCSWGHFDAEAALRYLVRELKAVEAKEPEVNPHLGKDEMSARMWEMARMRREAVR